jgi:hypothetical protein
MAVDKGADADVYITAGVNARRLYEENAQAAHSANPAQRKIMRYRRDKGKKSSKVFNSRPGHYLYY